MENRSPIKRISIMIGEEQYERIAKDGLNISAFIRNLIEDHFSNQSITLRVSKKTHDLYTKLVSNTGATDEDLDPLILDVLRKLLDQRIEKIKNLKKEFEP